MSQTQPAAGEGTSRHRIDVLMVSTSYPTSFSDWRGIFIRNLAFSLARRSDLNLQIWAPPGDIPENVGYAPTSREKHWLTKLMASGGIAHLYRSGGIRAIWAPTRLLWILRKAYGRTSTDVYHVNWLQNALSLPKDGRPLLTTVLGTDLQLLKLPMVRSLLRRSFKHRRVVICPNAGWMVPILSDAFSDVAKVCFVPFGIDPSWYEMSRSVPSTPGASWLCVTRLTRDKVGALFEWGAPHFSGSKRSLHLFGPMQEDMPLPDWVHYHGPATPEILRDDWFPRAHGLITLSQHAEGRPQVMLEAMAAGLPIIASDLPAHMDIIQHGLNGMICKAPADVGTALETLEDGAENRRMGEQGRAWVSKEIGTWDDCAGRYATLYHDLLCESRT